MLTLQQLTHRTQTFALNNMNTMQEKTKTLDSNPRVPQPHP